MIRDAVLPASPEDADPFVGKRTNDGVEALAFFLTLPHEGLRPDRVFPGFLAPFNEGLARVIVAA